MDTMVSMATFGDEFMKTFHPIQSAFVNASPPYLEGTQYKISIGNEFFDDVPQIVLTIQMVYNGRIEGRKSPAFPANTDDFTKVSSVATKMLQSYSEGGHRA